MKKSLPKTLRLSRESYRVLDAPSLGWVAGADLEPTSHDPGCQTTPNCSLNNCTNNANPATAGPAY
jgi:hypothetical protein